MLAKFGDEEVVARCKELFAAMQKDRSAVVRSRSAERMAVRVGEEAKAPLTPFPPPPFSRVKRAGARSGLPCRERRRPLRRE